MAEPTRIKTRLINKHAQAAVWEATQENFTPLEAEFIIYDKDNTHPRPRLKIGDGSQNVNELPFYIPEEADKLTTARTITLNGAVKGSTTFDGSANVSIVTSLDGTLEGEFEGIEESHSHEFTSDPLNVSIAYTPAGTVTGSCVPKGTISTPSLVGSLSQKELTLTVSRPTFTGETTSVDSSFTGEATTLDTQIQVSGTTDTTAITPEGTVVVTYN